jgi:hypothetical protein
MCYLTTVTGPFQGRVLAGRLGAEGVMVALKGRSDSLTPGGSTVDVLVPADQLTRAREILLADAVDDAFGSMELSYLDLASESEPVPAWALDAGLGDGSLSGAAHSAAGLEAGPTTEEVAEMWAERRAHRQKNVLQILSLVMVALLLLATFGFFALVVANAF